MGRERTSVHLLVNRCGWDRRKAFTACGRGMAWSTVADDPHGVTCGMCRRSNPWREAVSARAATTEAPTEAPQEEDVTIETAKRATIDNELCWDMGGLRIYRAPKDDGAADYWMCDIAVGGDIITRGAHSPFDAVTAARQSLMEAVDILTAFDNGASLMASAIHDARFTADAQKGAET